MAVRRNTKNSDAVRERIQSAQLAKFLETHALTGTDVKKSQITAAIALLRKTIPDLQSIEGAMDMHVYKHEEALDKLE